MSKKPYVSARGVYYDLEHSPYRYTSPSGECFVFSSQKKLEIYAREVETLKEKIEKVIAKYTDVLGEDWALITKSHTMLKVYKYVYNNMKVV